MTKKNKATAIIITLVLAIFVFLGGFSNDKKEILMTKYQVYLDGKAIGIINDSKELYSLINKEQSQIKDEYNVDQVYPPKGFEIESYISYNNNSSSVEDIYDHIKNNKSFTIKGYTVNIIEDSKVKYRVNILDKKIFEEAINNLIDSFVDKEKYSDYMNDKKVEIKDTGSYIENMYFKENITIKENYLSTSDKIFTNVDDLTKYLMFEDENANKEYIVKKGDTIKSIADANELNPAEFLIANPRFTSENNMLAVGESVNVALIKPKLNLVSEEYVIEDTEVKYETETKYDSSRPASYRNVERKGSNGIQRVAKRVQVINGATPEGAVIDKDNTYMIKDVVNEIVVRGNKSYNPGGGTSGVITGVPYDDGSNWAWPTNVPYVLSSPYGWRWGSFHYGQDITGTGYGSPIYSIGSGVVRAAGWGGMVGKASGMNVVIEHPNGYWSVYAHMSDIYVSEGQTVSRKQKIGAMGKSGVATGTHLHLTISIGQPYAPGSKFINPMVLWGK